jgi:hypothetical protein
MSTSSAPRRSTRTTARPEQFAEQQTAYALHAQEATLLRRAQQLSLECDQPHSSDEETEADDDSDEGSTSEEEMEEKENVDPNVAWTNQTHDINLPPFTLLLALASLVTAS